MTRSKNNLPASRDILALARWILRCPMIRSHYALAGGTWLTLRLPKVARLSRDVDVLSSREEVSSYKAMMEIVGACEKEKISYRSTRRGKHFCQIFICYPTRDEIKVDIGKIWHPVTIAIDPELGCPVLSSYDMIREKLQCIVDRIEPTDLYDLCCLYDAHPSEFRNALAELAQSGEIDELLIRIQRCLEVTEGLGTKETLGQQQQHWMEQVTPRLIKEITHGA